MIPLDQIEDRPLYAHDGYLWALDTPGLVAQWDYYTGTKYMDHAVEGVSTWDDLVDWVESQ